MEKIGRFLIVLQILLFGYVAIANDINVTATVDRNEMRAGDTFTLSVSVTSSQSVVVGEPQLPNLTNFSLVNQWQNSSTRSTLVNGTFEIQRSQNFNYMLSVEKEGTYNIDAIKLDVNGNIFRTKPIQLKVYAASAQVPNLSNNNRRQRQQAIEDPFQEMEDAFSRLLRQRPRAGMRTEPVNPQEAFFIQVEVDKTEVYVGEQVTATWYIYTRSQIRDIDTLKYPSLNKFWKEDIELASRLNFKPEIINGIPYQKALLASYALFPIKEGSAVVDSYKAKCTVIARNGFGFGKPYVYTKSSKPVKIKVHALPADGKPENFTGAVGQFLANAAIDGNQVPVNQPVTLKIRFEGRGNAKLIDLPNLELPPSVELYDTKKDSKFFKDGRSYKEFEVLLIPRDAGEVKIPAMEFGFFDPDKRKYYTQSTKDINFNVVPSAGENKIGDSRLKDSSGQKIAAKEYVPQLILAWEADKPMIGINVGLLWSILFLLSVVFLAWRAYKEFGLGQRQQNLEEALKLKLSLALKLVDQGQSREAAVAATNIIYFVLGQLTGSILADESVEKIIAKLAPSIRNAYADDLRKQLSLFEVIGFAPEEMAGVYSDKKKMKENFKSLESLLFNVIKVGFVKNSKMQGVRV